MNNNIQLPSTHAKHIKEFYRNRLLEIEKEAAEIKILLKDIDSNTQSGSSIGTFPFDSPITSHEATIVDSPFPKTYNPKWSNQKKAQFIIRVKGKALTSAEIVDTIMNEYEHEIEGGRKKLLGSMSSVLSGNCKPGGIFTRKHNDLDDWVYDVSKK